MDPLTLIGPAVSGVSSIIGNLQSSKNVKRQIEAQQRENALNRQFNASEAQKNRDFQSAQIASYRDYNTPANQMKSMQDAGLHPMAALGTLGATDPGTTSGAQASTSNSISPVGYQPLDMTATSQQLASTRLLNAQADKTESEAKNLDARTLTEDQIRSGLVTEKNLQVELGKLAVSLQEKEIEYFRYKFQEAEQMIENSKAELQEIVARTANIKSQTISNNIDNAWKSKTFETRVKQESARLGIMESEYKYLVASFSFRLMNLQADTTSKLASAFQASSLGMYMQNKGFLESDEYFSFKGGRLRMLNNENDRLEFDLSSDKKFRGVERTMGIIDSGLRSVKTLQDIIFRPAEFSVNAASTMLGKGGFLKK